MYLQLQTHVYIVLIFLLLGLIFSIKAKKLTSTAAFVGAGIGLLLFIAAGYTGFFMMTTFFILGTAATSHKKRWKEEQGFAESNKGKRNTAQVLANAGAPTILALLILLNPQNQFLYEVMIASSFASATADTLSSELGNVYGSQFINIKSFKKDTRGLDGVISLEGTALGVLGSALIAIVYCVGTSFVPFLIIVFSGTVGNIADSLIGATLERKHVLNNNSVNFLNTVIAAVVSLISYSFAI